ncbi:hypothetical protein GCM10009854_26600 [Saccharopolyspora halophila]|uniref:Uncharacterized protein n=1 Tax=Saccharopolyspora halophila TaxID=405551 RepID=A0ABN3GBG9_9PSEU
MAALGEMFPGSKLKHEGDEEGAGRGHDPGGPLDLEQGVVYLAPPQQETGDESDEKPEE